MSLVKYQLGPNGLGLFQLILKDMPLRREISY